MSLKIKKVKAILFDIDGTLSDSDDRMVQTVRRYVSPFFRDKAKEKAFARWIIMSAESPGNFFYNLADRFSLDSFLIQQIHRFSKRKQHHVKKYWIIPGISEMLKALTHLRLGIVSARDERSTYAFLEQFDLTHFFDVIVTSQTCEYTKPFPDPLLYAAEKLNLPAEHCLMVGDTTVDIKAARLAGMQSIGVLCGFGREKELRRARPDLILPSTADVFSYFSKKE